MRSDVVLATKVAGYSDDISWLRKDKTAGTRVSKAQVLESVDASLSRLGTDYIDLLQIEWPDRYTGRNTAGFDPQVRVQLFSLTSNTGNNIECL